MNDGYADVELATSGVEIRLLQFGDKFYLSELSAAEKRIIKRTAIIVGHSPRGAERRLKCSGTSIMFSISDEAGVAFLPRA